MRTLAGLFLLVAALLFTIQPQALLAQDAGSGGGSLARGGEVVGKAQFTTLRTGDATHGRVALGGEVVGKAQCSLSQRTGTDTGGGLAFNGNGAENILQASNGDGAGNHILASNGNGAGNDCLARGGHTTGNGLLASNGSNGAGNGRLASNGNGAGNGLLTLV